MPGRRRSESRSRKDVKPVGSEPPASPRRRGRPARLSREFIVDAVLGMLDRGPDEVLTIVRIAREVEAAPAALYRHFGNLDDLLDSVLAKVLESNDSLLDEKAAWELQLENWMHGLRGHLLRYPAVISLIGRTGRTSPAWLEASSTLVEILENAGLRGHDLAATYLWILEMTSGLVIQEALMPLPDQLANARASHDELSSSARARFEPILGEMRGLDGDALFVFAVEQASAIVALRRKASQNKNNRIRRVEPSA